MIDKTVDLLIVGGGLTGAALMLALADQGIRTTLVETRTFSDIQDADFDARTLALSGSSVRILQMLGVWPLLERDATPIKSIRISEQFRFAKAQLQAKKDDSLGYVVEMHAMNQAMHKLLDKKNVLAPAKLIDWQSADNMAIVQQQDQQLRIKASLIVAADGANSSVRRFSGLKVRTRDYHQQALVVNIGLARPHQGCAYERFTSSGPMAMLPMSDQRASLIWAVQPAEAQRLLNLDEKDFLQTLQHNFGYGLGRFIKVGRRSAYPLQQSIMPRQAAWPLVFVGNAAHTLHPVAGQGFNLGLRDVAALAQCIVQQGINADMLNTYQSMRNYDQTVITRGTDGLVQLFTNRLPGIVQARLSGLLIFDQLPFLKKILANHARGFAGILPDLVCGLALERKESHDAGV